MKTVIKAIIATAIIATSYTASARDGAFTGNVSSITKLIMLL
ncbi:hypothetical protein [Photobacterium aquimaris]|nr:hypothetical protein [Photobacterium aquimaris]